MLQILLVVVSLIPPGMALGDIKKDPLVEIDTYPAILYMTNLLGELKPCGCMTNHHGGFAKRKTLVARERSQHPVLLLEAGNSFLKTPFIAPTEQKENEKRTDTIIELFKKIELDAYLPGPYDFGHYYSKLKSSGLPIVCANIMENGRTVFPGYKLVKLDKFTIALTGIADVGLNLGQTTTVIDPKIALKELKIKEAHALLVVLNTSEADLTDIFNLKGEDVFVIDASGTRNVDFPEKKNGAFFFEIAGRGQYLGQISFKVAKSLVPSEDLSKTYHQYIEYQWANGEFLNLRQTAIKNGIKDEDEAIRRYFSADPESLAEYEKYLKMAQSLKENLQKLPDLNGDGFINRVIPITSSVEDDREILDLTKSF